MYSNVYIMGLYMYIYLFTYICIYIYIYIYKSTLNKAGLGLVSDFLPKEVYPLS
jgi:hypothetical protein